MTIEQLRAAHDARPFRPFMHLADGERITVHSCEFVDPPPVGRTVVVDQPDGTMKIVDLLLVTNLEFQRARHGRRKRRPASARMPDTFAADHAFRDCFHQRRFL
jgi:hypothetical protein